MNFKIFAVNLVVPLFVVLMIAVFSGVFRLKKKESIKNDLFDYFKKAWNEDEKAEEDSFFQKFFRLFLQAYEYEKYKEDVNKSKYNFYKLLVLFVVLSVPFLSLFLITRKEWIINDSAWNDIYLYTVILVPLVFAYLVNKYIRIRQYHETWYRHLRNRHQMEWRMMVFVKDRELLKVNETQGTEGRTSASLKTAFINDLCDYWKTTADIPLSAAKEENIFEEIGSLFRKS